MYGIVNKVEIMYNSYDKKAEKIIESNVFCVTIFLLLHLHVNRVCVLCENIPTCMGISHEEYSNDELNLNHTMCMVSPVASIYE